MLVTTRTTRRVVAFGAYLTIALLARTMSAHAQESPGEMQAKYLLGQMYVELQQERGALAQQGKQMQEQLVWWQQCAASMLCARWATQNNSNVSGPSGALPVTHATAPK